MKFAQLALLGVAAAYDFEEEFDLEDDLEEDVRVKYSADAVKQFNGLIGEMMQNGMAAKAAMKKEWPTMKQDVRKMGRWAEARYGPDFMAWAHSGSVRASEMHKKAMFKASHELHTVMSDLYVIYNDFKNAGASMGKRMNPDGSYEEWINNGKAKAIFKDLYHLAQDVRKLAESPMARNQRKLERATLHEPSFHRLAGKVMDDINVHSWKQLEVRAKEVGMKIQAHMKSCPYFKKFVSILMRMKKVCETNRVVTELDAPGWEQWWNKNNFKNPFAGMKNMLEHGEEEEFLI